MKHLVLIAIGGASGALCRHWMVLAVNGFTQSRFPFGTLAVNLIGSFCIGVLYVLITERLSLHPDWRSVLMVGFMGAFTTFSTFSLETIALIENGQLMQAGLYVLFSLVLCVIAAGSAVALTRMLA